MNTLTILSKSYFRIVLCLILGILFSAVINSVDLPGVTDIPEPLANSCIQDPKEGTSNLTCEGITFKLNVPEVCMTKACGLIVDVHGWQMSSSLQNIHTNLSKLGEEAGFIVIHPNAKKTTYGRSWSDKDDKKVFAILSAVKNAFHVMENRVHITGFSQGGFMSWRFVCNYSSTIASAAPLAHGAGNYNRNTQPLTINIMEDCFKGEQIDILYGHGQKDGLAAYSGAIGTLKSILGNWSMNKKETLVDQHDYKRVRFTNDKGTQIEFINYNWVIKTKSMANLGGHCFPGSGGYLGCGKDNEIHWGEEVIEFFLNHPKN